MKIGMLHLIKSKYSPVFRTPMQVQYAIVPRKGQSFLFSSAQSCSCWTSVVQKIKKLDGFAVIETLNSVYILADVSEKALTNAPSRDKL